MRLGLIARADSRGLGIQCKAFYDQLRPHKTLVVDCPSAQPLPLRMDWYPDATWVHGLPTTRDFRHWLQDVDVVYTAETGYGTALWDEAERQGVKTVLHANFEFLNRNDRPTVWAAPSLWNFGDFPAPKLHLPVPVETDRFPIRRYPVYATAKRFLHVVGRPTWNGAQDLHRNGTTDVIQALQHVTSDIEVTFRCQASGYVETLLQTAHIPGNVTVAVDSGDHPNYWDAYTDQDVLLMPRRFGGLCLPVNEALGAGIPALMTDIPPNNQWLPKPWLVHAEPCGSFVAKQRVQMYQVDLHLYAAKIDEMASSARVFADARLEAQRLGGELSWDSLRDTYIKTFEEL